MEAEREEDIFLGGGKLRIVQGGFPTTNVGQRIFVTGTRFSTFEVGVYSVGVHSIYWGL